MDARAISGTTRVAALIGSPARHSLSPAILNAGFAARGLDWVFVVHEVPAGQGEAALAAVRTLGIGGLSVTMPHKAAAAAAVDERTPVADGGTRVLDLRSEVEGGGPLASWFGGAAERTLVITMANTGTIPVENPPTVVTYGRGEDPTDLLVRPELGSIAPSRNISCPPIAILSPSASIWRPVIRVPLMSTPLRLPRSSIATPPSPTVSSACLRDTSGSSSDSWQSALRPMKNSPSGTSRSWAR